MADPASVVDSIAKPVKAPTSIVDLPSMYMQAAEPIFIAPVIFNSSSASNNNNENIIATKRECAWSNHEIRLVYMSKIGQEESSPKIFILILFLGQRPNYVKILGIIFFFVSLHRSILFLFLHLLQICWNA